MRRSIVLALLCLPTVLLAQQSDRVISPGMSRAQVVAALGAPATQRTASEFTYMFYPNSCGRECGMNDLVILRNDSVSDAIFRSPNRHYTGTSSSPQQATPALAPRRSRPAAKPMTTRDTTTTKRKPTTPAPARAKPAAPAPAKGARTTQLKPPAKANDATPSIPTKTTPMPAAPAKTPATTPSKTPATAPAKAPAPDKKP
jgi:hypothetical protein